MELFKEILIGILEKEEINVIFPNLELTVTETVEMKCYEALEEIRNIIYDDSFSDFECIEKVVCVFERMGSGAGCRHDF